MDTINVFIFIIKPLALRNNRGLDILKSELNISSQELKNMKLKISIKTYNLMNLVDLLEKYKIIFDETYNQLAIISVTIPVSSTACGRKFSGIRKLKAYMMNEMSNERFVHLSCISKRQCLGRNQLKYFLKTP